MGKQMNGGSGGKQENMRRSLIHGSRYLTVFLVIISMIHIAKCQKKMSIPDQVSNTLRSPRSSQTMDKPRAQSSMVCNTTECDEAAKEIKSSMNLTVDPCENFYEFACGRYWLHNPLNGSYEYVVGSFEKSDEWFRNYLRDKLDDGLAKFNGISDEVMNIPSDLFKSCMDFSAIENEGIAPLRQLIRQFGGWSLVEENGEWDEKKWGFAKAIKSIHRHYTSEGPLFIVKTREDIRNHTRYMFQINPSPAPSGSYSSPNVDAYRALIRDVALGLGGCTRVRQKVRDLVEFERKLAEIKVPTIELIKTTFEDRITVADLQKEIPTFNWHDHLQGMFFPKRLPDTEELDVSALSTLKKVMALVNNTSKSVLSNFLVWNVIKQELKHMPRYYRCKNEEYSRNINNNSQTTNKKRWRTCVDYVNIALKDIVGAGFAADNFSTNMDRIKLVKKMIVEVREAFKENIKSLTWIDEHTKRAILDVVNNEKDGVGFPKYLLDPIKVSKKFAKYNNLNIRNNTLLRNRITLKKVKQKELIAKFQKPWDQEEWTHIGIQDANFEKDSYRNRMGIPLLQIRPPYFYPVKELRALNFGAMGQIIGHETTHNFGVKLRKFNKDGEIKGQLWTNKSLERFEARTACFEKQYSQYHHLGVQVNGTVSLDENLADNNGIQAALKAYYKWAKLNPSETWLLPGLNFTNEQLFYIGHAQFMCNNPNLALVQHKLKSNYATRKPRLNGELSNSCEFANAFKCKINSPMNPVTKCALWYETKPLS